MSFYSTLRRAGLPSIYVYSTVTQLPLVGNTAGTIAYVEDISGLFLYNNGWRPLDTSENGPIINVAPVEIITLSGTPYSTTIQATDPDGLNVIYSVGTTGTLDPSTTVTIDEDTGLLQVSSTYPSDDFSIILTCSDGVFATTRTIPVTITNRPPTFTVEPAASFSTNAGVEFSYQYAVQDLDDGQTLEFNIEQSLNATYPNLQHIDTVFIERNYADGLGHFGSATGGDYMTLTPPEDRNGHGVDVFKWNITENKFELFQQDVLVDTPTNSTTYMTGTAINNDWMFVSNYDSSTQNRSAKVLKYNSTTEQFEHWAGGDLDTIVTQNNDWDDKHKLCAAFGETPLGETALIVGLSVSSGESNTIDGALWLFVYDSVNDTWIYKDRTTQPFYTYHNSLAGQSDFLTGIREISVNPFRKTEFATATWSMHSAWDIELDNDGGSTASNTYSLTFRALAAQGFTNDSNSSTWRPSGMHWQDENTIWLGNANDGRIYKITRGPVADVYNNSTWTVDYADGAYVGGTATLETYDTVVGSYNASLRYWYWSSNGSNTSVQSAYDRLFVNGNIGVHGDYWFTLDSATNTVTYNGTQTETWQDPLTLPGPTKYIGANYTGFTSRGLFNRDHNLFIATIYGISSRSTSRCLIFGVGINADVDSNGTVTGTPKSFGNYSLTTSVTDGVDTTTDSVTIDVPGGVSFSTTPPTNKTVTASGSTTFDADASSGNYTTPEIKFTTDIDYSLQQTIAGATASAYKDGELFVTVNNQVRVYPVNELGEVDTNYTTLDSTGLVDSNTEFGTNLTVTDDYLLVGRKGEPSTLEHRVQKFGNYEQSAYWSYATNQLGQITGIGFTFDYYGAVDWHQSDTSGELIWKTKFRQQDNLSGAEGVIDLEKLDKKTNRINTLETNSIGFSGLTTRRTWISYFKTFHPDYQGQAGTGIAWRAYINSSDSNHNTWRSYIERYSYDDDGNLTNTSGGSQIISTTTGNSYDSPRMYTTTSPDGKYIAVSSGSSTARYIDMWGDDSGGTLRKWSYTTSNSSQTDNFITLGWVKNEGEYQLVATHGNTVSYSGSRYVEVFNRPTTTSSSFLPITNYSIAYTDPTWQDLTGPIGCDNQGRFIVGKKLFSFSTSPNTITLLNTFSVYPYNINGATGYEDKNLRISYYPSMDTWFVHNGGVNGADGGDEYDLTSMDRYFLSAFTVDGSNNFTSIFENIYDFNEFREYNFNTGINNNGDTIAYTNKMENGIATTRYPLRNYINNEYSLGTIYGASSIQIYKKINSTWTHQGEVSFNNAGSLMTVGPNTHIHTAIQLNADELLIGLPGAWQGDAVIGGALRETQGALTLVKYNTSTTQWDTLDIGGYEEADYDTADYYAQQHNNIGYSIAQWNDLILEAGPRELVDDIVVAQTSRESPLMLYNIVDQKINLHRALQASGGVAENVIANSYIAFGNTETQGQYTSSGGGELHVYNSNHNDPLQNISTYSQAPEYHFPEPQLFTQPNTFNGYYTYDFATRPNGEIRITGGNSSGSNTVENFEPSGDYTIQFHLSVDNTSYNYLFCAKTYVNFYSSHIGFKLYTGGGNIYLTNNWITTNGTPPAFVSGLQWNNVVPTDGSWHHYAIVYDSVNEQHTLWQDGVKISTQNSPSSNPKIFQTLADQSYGSTLYLWSIGQHRSDNGVQTDQTSNKFDIANLILDYGAKYDPADNNIDISVYGTGTVYDIIDDNTWCAVAIGNSGNAKDYANNFDVEVYSSGTNWPNTMTSSQAYAPANIDIANWVRYTAGNETTIVTASNESVFVFIRDVDNTFSLNKILTPGGTITEISISENQAESIIVTTTQGVKVYSRNITPYLAQPISYSNGTVTINANTQTGTYTLKTYAKDGKAVSIKHTAMTHS